MVLLVPQPTGASPDQILTTDRSTWLLVDPSMVSFDGSTCDRVGTSFTAFKWQAGGCGRAPQVSPLCAHMTVEVRSHGISTY